MANQYYQSGIDFLQGENGLINRKLRVAAVSMDYVADTASDANLSDISQEYILRTVPLENLNVNGKKITADSVIFEGISLSDFRSLVIYVDGCSSDASTLLVCIDSGFTGQPLNSDAYSLEVVWDSEGIFEGLNSDGSINQEIGAQELRARYFELEDLEPEISDEGYVTCAYAKSKLANIIQAQGMCGIGKTVRWNGRLLTQFNIKELIDLEKHWRMHVRASCSTRRPLMFHISRRNTRLN